MKVEKISTDEAKPWILQRHYARRMPQISYCFGLVVDNVVCGIVAYGVPANRMNSELGGYPMLELVRLCVNCDIKNASSFLVGQSLKKLPRPLAVISYADTTVGHLGIIYQATNWYYTGLSKGDTEWVVDGKKYHRKNVFNTFGTSSVDAVKSMGHKVETTRQGDKHRYYFFLGTKHDKANMKKALNFPILPYPKGETKRYDTSEKIETQSTLF